MSSEARPPKGGKQIARSLFAAIPTTSALCAKLKALNNTATNLANMRREQEEAAFILAEMGRQIHPKLVDTLHTKAALIRDAQWRLSSDFVDQAAEVLAMLLDDGAVCDDECGVTIDERKRQWIAEMAKLGAAVRARSRSSALARMAGRKPKASWPE